MSTALLVIGLILFFIGFIALIALQGYFLNGKDLPWYYWILIFLAYIFIIVGVILLAFNYYKYNYYILQTKETFRVYTDSTSVPILLYSGLILSLLFLLGTALLQYWATKMKGGPNAGFWIAFSIVYLIFLLIVVFMVSYGPLFYTYEADKSILVRGANIPLPAEGVPEFPKRIKFDA